MAEGKQRGTHRGIRLSRRVGVVAATLLGATITSAVSIYGLAAEVVRSNPSRATVAFIAAGVVFIPLILAHVQRVKVLRGSADIYASARRLGAGPLPFAVGWLVLGGMLGVGALLTRAIAIRVDLIAERAVGYSLDNRAWIAATLALVALTEMVSGRRWWAARNVLVVICLALTGGIIGWELFTRPATDELITAGIRFDLWLTLVSVVGAGLWFLDIVLTHSVEVKKPEKTLPLTTVTAWLIGSGMGALAAYFLRHSPHLFMANVPSRITWHEAKTILVGLAVGATLCWVALSRVVRMGLRVVSAMGEDGYLRTFLQPAEGGERRRPLVALLVGALIVAPSAFRFEQMVLGELTAASFYLASIVLFVRVAFSADATRRWTSSSTAARSLRLWSGVGAASASYALFLLPAHASGGMLGWVLVGLLGYVVLGGSKHLGEEEEEEFDESSEVLRDDEAESTERVVAVALEGSDMRSLVRTAMRAARAANTQAALVRVLPLDEEIPFHRQHAQALLARARLRKAIAAIEGAVDWVKPRVRLAPTIAAGVADAAEDRDAALILLNVPHRGAARTSAEGEVESIYASTSRVIAVAYGTARLKVDSVIVPTAGGPHVGIALRLGQALVGEEGTVTLLRVVSNSAEEEEAAAALEALAAEEGREGGPSIETEVISDPRPIAALKERSRGVPLILGASRDPLIQRAVYGGAPFELARERLPQTIVVKESEKLRVFWLRRFWETLIHPFPPVSSRDRARVLSSMGDAARGDTDFFVLMIVASLIAIAGLVLDSTAVVIGAMLVAPLMSPIVATAHGIVLGSLPLIRRGSISVGRGALSAIAVATVFTMLLPSQVAPHEVIARVAPNLLDLVVAMAAGAAGAYAASRPDVAGALPGVAISVALVPPLCVVGFGLGTGDLAIAGGALLLFATNLSGIILVGAFVFVLLGFRPSRAGRTDLVKWGIVAAIASMMALMIPLGFATKSSFQSRLVEWRVISAMEEITEGKPVTVQDLDVSSDGEQVHVDATLLVYEEISDEQLDGIVEGIQRSTRDTVDVRLTLLSARVVRGREPTSSSSTH